MAVNGACWGPGLTLLNLSLDTLKEARFEQMTRRRGLSRVLDTIHQAVALGFNPVKVGTRGLGREGTSHVFAYCLSMLVCQTEHATLAWHAVHSHILSESKHAPLHFITSASISDGAQVNVVVMRGQNDDEILDFVEMTRKLPLNVRFIEYMPFDGNVWSNDKLVPYAELAAQINEHYSAGLQRLQVDCTPSSLHIAQLFAIWWLLSLVHTSAMGAELPGAAHDDFVVNMCADKHLPRLELLGLMAPLSPTVPFARRACCCGVHTCALQLLDELFDFWSRIQVERWPKIFASPASPAQSAL